MRDESVALLFGPDMSVQLIHGDDRLVDLRLSGSICASGARAIASINVRAVCEILSAFQGRVLMRINSPGGNVQEALAIHSYMRGLGRPITTRVEGRVSSAAVIIAMGGDQVEIEVGASLLIHSCSMFVVPELLCAAVRKVFELNVEVARILAERSGRPVDDELERIQAGERVLDANDAVRNGYADRVVAVARRGV